MAVTRAVVDGKTWIARPLVRVRSHRSAKTWAERLEDAGVWIIAGLCLAWLSAILSASPVPRNVTECGGPLSLLILGYGGLQVWLGLGAWRATRR